MPNDEYLAFIKANKLPVLDLIRSLLEPKELKTWQANCEHTCQTQRDGGYWCTNCGRKIWELEHRRCGECAVFAQDRLFFLCPVVDITVGPNTNGLRKPGTAACWRPIK
jgi:hypothetical protein